MRERLLARIGKLAVARPYAIVLVALVGAAVSAALLPSLDISSSRFELIDEGTRSIEVGARRDLVVAVTSDDAADGRAAVDALALQLAELGEVTHVFARIEPDAWRGRELALMSAETRDTLIGALVAREPGAPISLEALVEEARVGLAGDPTADLDSLEVERPPIDDARGLEFLRRLLDDARSWVGDPDQREIYLDASPADVPVDTEGYLVSTDETTRYLFVTLRESTDRYDYVAPTVRDAREIGAAIASEHRVEISFTGYPALAVDEVDAIRNGSLVTGVMAAFLVMILFVVGFRSTGGIAVAGIPLGIGIAWAFGMIVLTVGELNLLTQAAAPVFAGLGIDFSVHLVAAYARARRDGAPHAEAVDRSMRGAGKAAATGGITTAGAFLVLSVAEYRAFADLGIVAGLGLLLVLIAVLFVTPALLTIGERRSWIWLSVSAPPIAERSPFVSFVTSRPLVFVATALAVTVVLAAGIGRVEFDADVEALMPGDAESVVAARSMVTGSAFTNEHLVLEVTDTETLRDLSTRMEALPSVARVESLAPFLLEGSTAPTIELGPAEPSSLAGLRRNLTGLAVEAEGASAEVRRVASSEVADELTALALVCRALEADLSDAAAPRLIAYDDALARRLEGLLAAPTEIPRALRARLSREVDGEVRYRLYIYPAIHVFDEVSLNGFLRETRGVDPTVAGAPVGFAAFLDAMRESLRTASWLALLVIVLLLAADLRRPLDVLLALAPVALGVTWLLGLMGWLGIDANMANAAALPLVLGIGVDDGVHLIHQHRRDGDVSVALTRVLRALVLTTITTIAGFGTIGLAAHRGMQSFALLMVIGSACCLASTLFVLPALLRIRERRGAD